MEIFRPKCFRSQKDIFGQKSEKKWKWGGGEEKNAGGKSKINDRREIKWAFQFDWRS
jgi:hypothetical protein